MSNKTFCSEASLLRCLAQSWAHRLMDLSHSKSLGALVCRHIWFMLTVREANKWMFGMFPNPLHSFFNYHSNCRPDMFKILVSCCSYCTWGPSKGRGWQWISLVDAWCIAPQYQWEIGSLLVFPVTVSNNELSLPHTVRTLYRELKII